MNNTIFSVLRQVADAAGPDHVRQLRAFLALTSTSSALQALAVLILFPLLGALFSDEPGHLAEVGWWVLALVAVIAVITILELLAARAAVAVGMASLRVVERHGPPAILGWPRHVLTQEKVAELRTLISSGGTEVVSSIVLLVTPLISAMVVPAVLAIGLAFIYWPLALACLAVAILLLGALWLAIVMEKRSNENFATTSEELDSRLLEFATIQPTLRTNGRTRDSAAAVDRAITSHSSSMRRVLLLQIPAELIFTVTLQVTLLIFAIVIWSGWNAGGLSGIAAAVSMLVAFRVVEQITSLSQLVNALLGATRTLAQARELVDVPVTPASASHPGGSGASAPAVLLEKVGLVYPDGTQALDGIDLDIPAGSITVIIGASGSGKTSLLDVIAGLEQPTAGEVRLDGRYTDEFSRRAAAAVVFQSTALNAGTLEENLRAVNSTLTTEDMDRIATAAQLDGTLNALPKRWDTPVGELGRDLSGGERQRVGLARALAKDVPLLLIDEATSALDASTEGSVVAALNELRGHHTIVIITHRPASLSLADHIVVLDGGQVVEQGSRDHLMRHGSAYRRMVDNWNRAAEWRV